MALGVEMSERVYRQDAQCVRCSWAGALYWYPPLETVLCPNCLEKVHVAVSPWTEEMVQATIEGGD